MERPPDKQIAEEMHPGNPRTFLAFEWNIILLMIQEWKIFIPHFPIESMTGERVTGTTKCALREALFGPRNEI